MRESRFNIWVEREDAVYVFNGMSGALLRVPHEQHRAVRRLLDDGDPSCPPDLLLQLAQGRMLVSDEGDDVALLARRYAVTQDERSHFALTLVTSLGCNFDCPYCFEAKHPEIMDAEVQRDLLAVLDDQIPHLRTFHATWFGGEPLVGKKPLLALSDAFIERCDRAGVAYSADITTNGYLLDRDTCAALRDRRVSNAQVCLDGPPEIHDRMRPLAGGRPSFWGIVRNLHHAVDYLQVAIRINVDARNIEHTQALLQILAGEGLAGKLTAYVGQIVGVTENPQAPSATYRPSCLTNPEFARAELAFKRLAARHGFGQPSLPRPTGAPCTAVRANEFVVGSGGELYKCWDSVGTARDVIGHIRDYRDVNGRLARWLRYDPFADAECRRCIALPVCMGGCAHHAMDLPQRENRCGTFKTTYREQVLDFVEWAEAHGTAGLVPATKLVRQMEPR